MVAILPSCYCRSRQQLTLTAMLLIMFRERLSHSQLQSWVAHWLDLISIASAQPPDPKWVIPVSIRYGPITSWQIDGEAVEIVSDFIFFDSKITADGDCSHEIKRCLLLGRKVMTKLDSILKSRDISLSTKVHLVKAMVFPIVMYGCESWTIKNAERERESELRSVVFDSLQPHRLYSP